jgi:hypothetical protein
MKPLEIALAGFGFGCGFGAVFGWYWSRVRAAEIRSRIYLDLIKGAVEVLK